MLMNSKCKQQTINQSLKNQFFVIALIKLKIREISLNEILLLILKKNRVYMTDKFQSYHLSFCFHNILYLSPIN